MKQASGLARLCRGSKIQGSFLNMLFNGVCRVEVLASSHLLASPLATLSGFQATTVVPGGAGNLVQRRGATGADSEIPASVQLTEPLI